VVIIILLFLLKNKLKIVKDKNMGCSINKNSTNYNKSKEIDEMAYLSQP
jgi:hypothetical protein